MRLAPFLLTVALPSLAHAQFSEGSILYHPIAGFDTYLTDANGVVQHTWAGSARPGLSVELQPDGRLLRTLNSSLFGSGGAGAVELVDWDGTDTWSYDANTAERLSHHDATMLPNGNVLILCWDWFTGTEAIDMGRDPATVGAVFAPDEIIEVQPTGPTTGTIVWNWKASDHLVQDFDATKANFGVIADNPHRIDVNYGNVPGNGDWLHGNGIDYDPIQDRILLSVRKFSEFWVIDHSTTTAEAAGSTGGDAGRGGDLLYRWGNPAAYGRGFVADQQLFRQHDAQWIPPGRPGAGHVLVFNNGNGRPTGPSSSVEEVDLPEDGAGGYILPAVGPFGPSAPAWSYEDPIDPLSFYTAAMGGCERLANGNTMICLAQSGIFREVAPDQSTVHEFVNPLPGTGSGAVFRTRTYPVDPFPVSFCPGNPNSVGPGARMGWDGSVSVLRNDFVLTVTNAPPNEFGLFFYGANATSAPLGDGIRCIGEPFYRLLPPVQMDGAGVATFAMDLTQPPQVGAEIEVGSTWHFQFWHRDDPGFGTGSNLSDALTVTFWR